jgi:hypothetical protein
MRIGIIITVWMALLVGIVGCGSSGNDSSIGASSSLGIITASTTTGVKSVYLTKIDATSITQPSQNLSGIYSSATLSGLTQTLAYISTTGNNEPIAFETSSGKQVILNVTSLKAIKESFIAISFDAMVEFQMETQSDGGKTYTVTVQQAVTGKALADMSSGKVYDLSGYDIENMLIDANYIYITKNSFKSLYKIPFDDLSQAIPLNNGDFTPAGTLLYIINNRIVAGDQSFDVNGVTVPKTLTSVLLTDSISTMTGIGEPFSSAIELTSNGSYPPYIIDNAGNIWGYRFDNNGKYAKFQVSLDTDGKTVVSNYQEFMLSVPLNTWTHLFMINGTGYYADHLTIGDQSYYYVKRNTDAGITFEAGSSTFGNSYPGWAGNCAIYYDGSIYWVSNSTIYSMNLSLNQLSEIYSNLNLLNPVTVDNKYITLSISSGTLIFYQYATATTVGTYALTIGSATPALLSQSEADIDKIVELSF